MAVKELNRKFFKTGMTPDLIITIFFSQYVYGPSVQPPPFLSLSSVDIHPDLKN